MEHKAVVRWLTTTEAAARAGVKAPATVRLWIANGLLPATATMGGWLIAEHDLEKLLAERGRTRAITFSVTRVLKPRMKEGTNGRHPLQKASRRSRKAE